ncbi:imm11 family protein [Litchfieldia alkalitelluris]|uniref:imm11 family protein n=1 Tax=Litchfieldia alkalitelluris TaxID=304268 RepID=UPI000998D0B8|nr:DUF1629 domain-containing protein [Litchfieldia alkalitelluris]
MKIWQMTRVFNGFEVLKFSNPDDRKVFSDNFIGLPMKENWASIKVETYSKGKESDSPDGLLLAPIFSEKAVNLLKVFLKEDQVEILPISKYGGKKYFAINVINVLDGIDGEHSEVSRSRHGIILGYDRFAFKRDIVSGQDMFKVLNHETKRVISSKVFVSDRFRDKVIESDLQGFDFIEVWNSESTADQVEYSEISNSDKLYTFDEASKIAEDQNKTFVSGKWAIRFDEGKEFQIGQLQEDGSYNWVNPIYYPPIFIGMKWEESK